MRNKLVYSPVVYNDIDHSYTLGDTVLSGITGMIGRQLFPDKYSNVPEGLLRSAAERGKNIHAEIEMMLNGFNPSEISDEAMAFSMLNIPVLESEYIVSDGERFASPIDIVTEDLDLCDIKTTYTLDEEYCSWQLSVYAYLFELQNPRLKAGKLKAIWLRGNKAEVVELPRIPSPEIARLLACEAMGERFVPLTPDLSEANDILAKIGDAEKMVLNIKKELDRAEEESKKLKSGLLKIMQGAGVTKYESNGLSITVKKGYTRETVDSAKLKAELPEIYGRYLKTTEVAPSLTIKEKKL